MSIKIEYKPREELEELLHGVGRIFILRCGWCASSQGVSVAPAFGELKALLRGLGIEVESCRVAAVCSHAILYERLRRFYGRIRRADALGGSCCALGIKTLFWVTEGTKRIIPLCDTVGLGGREVDWDHAGGPETCVPGCVCVLGVTRGICTVGNCPERRRTPCVPVEELEEGCRVDGKRGCPFHLLLREGRLEGLLGFERDFVQGGGDRVPLFQALNPPAHVGRYGRLARITGTGFGKLSAPFAALMNLFGH